MHFHLVVLILHCVRTSFRASKVLYGLLYILHILCNPNTLVATPTVCMGQSAQSFHLCINTFFGQGFFTVGCQASHPARSCPKFHRVWRCEVARASPRHGPRARPPLRSRAARREHPCVASVLVCSTCSLASCSRSFCAITSSRRAFSCAASNRAASASFASAMSAASLWCWAVGTAVGATSRLRES